MRFMKFLAGAGLAAMLAACGGGGGVGDSSGGGSGGGSGSTSTAASITLSASATSVSTAAGLPNSAVTVTAEVRNASGGRVSGEPVTFVTDSGVLSDASTSTSLLGAATAVLSSGTNKTPRNVTVAVTVGSITQTIVLPVVSAVSSIELNSSTVSLPSSAGSSVTITATVKNQANSGIADEPVTFSADSGVLQNALPLTAANGTATVILSAGSNVSSRNITVTVTAGAISKSIVIPVVPGSQVTGASLALSLVDGSGSSTSSVSAAGAVFAKATLKDATGNVVPNSRVSFSVNANLVNLKPAADVLTDSLGVATVQMSAASLSSAGAGTITASATVAQASVNAAKDFQLAPANLTLASFDVGSDPLAAYGNRPISVIANINGSPATTTPVQVTFTASCGTVSPASVTTDAAGKASTTYSADNANCAGSTVTLTASSVGVASSLTKTIAVSPIRATNLQFISASPENIYLLGSGSTTQSLLTFKVVDSSGNPVQNQAVELSLQNQGAKTGLSIDVLGNADPVAKTSNSSGQVSVAVFSGDVPTSVRVSATLPGSSPVIQTNSVVLTIASGKAVQKAASIAPGKWAIEGFNVDGVETPVTFSFSDRQGNPVPDGTEVNFVAETGGVMIPPRCVVANGSSRCSSNFRSNGTRPLNGRVSVMAYVAGEEDFVDLNANNKFDLGEPFTDIGDAYRDDNESFDFTAGEFSVPRGQASSCTARVAPNYLDVTDYGRANTCDGAWGTNEVRKQQVVVLATSQARIVERSVSLSQVVLTVSDANPNAVGANSMPVGTAFAAVKFSGSDDCTVKTTLPSLLANVYGPTDVVINLDKCVANDVIGFTVTSPLQVVTPFNVTIRP